MATTAAKFISQQDYDTGLQNYYQDLQKRTSRVGSSIQRAPRTVGRGGTPRTMSLRSPATLQQKAVREYDAIQQSAYNTNVGIVKSEEVARISSLSPEQRYLAADPNVRKQEAYANVWFWEDTGKRVNGQKVERVIGYTYKGGAYPTSLSGQEIGREYIGATGLIGNKATTRITGTRFTGQPHTTVDISYDPVGLDTSGRGMSQTDWSYVSTSRALPRIAADSSGSVFSPKAKYAGATDSTIRDRVTGEPLTLDQYNLRSKDPTVFARRNLLESGKGTATIRELRSKPQLFTSLPSQSIPTLFSTGVIYGSAGKGFISGSRVSFPHEVKTPSFQKRTGFSESDAFAGGVGLKIGEGSYDPSEIVNAFIDLKGGETLAESAKRQREEGLITQTKTVPVQLKSAPPTTTFAEAYKGLTTDFNFDITKKQDFLGKYGELTAGDVVRKLQAEGKSDLKDIDRTYELVYGTEGAKVEKARKKIKDTKAFTDIESGFYSEYGKDFGTFKEAFLTPENKKRITELNNLVTTLETQTTEKIDGKTVKQLESGIKSQETTMLKSRDRYSTYITNLEGKSATKTQLKKIETLYDKSESDRKTYNLMLDKYGKRTDKINKNIEKLDKYDDIIKQSDVELKVRRDFIDRLREKEKTLRETEPRFFDRIDTTPTGDKLKDRATLIASAAIGSINVIPKALTFKKSVKDYNIGLESYSSLVKDYEKFDMIGKAKAKIPKQLDESLFYLTSRSTRPSAYDVAENIFAKDGKGIVTTAKYLGGIGKDYLTGFGRTAILISTGGTKKYKSRVKTRGKELEAAVLFTKQKDPFLLDITKSTLASTLNIRSGKSKVASYLSATGKTPSQYTDYVYSPATTRGEKAKKFAKLTIGDPGVMGVAATVALPFAFESFGAKSLTTTLTAAQTPLGKAASELTTAGITVAGEDILGATGTFMGLKSETVGKMERLGGVGANIGSFFIPGRPQVALAGLSTTEIKKKPAESALLIGMGGAFKSIQSYGGAYVSRKLTSPAFAKLSQKAPYFKAGTYSLGKADLYQMGLTIPGKVATVGLGALYGASIYTRAAKAKSKYESRKIGKQVEQEFALLGLGGKLVSSVRPVGAWEAEGLKRHGELFSYGPDGAGPFRTRLFGKGASIKQYAKKMGMIEEPKSFEDKVLIKLGLKQATLKPEAKELANIFIKAGYITPTKAKFKPDQYRSTVSKIMKSYGKDVYLKGSKVGGEQIRGFRSVKKSDYDIIFTGSKAKYTKFKADMAKEMIKSNPTFLQENVGGQLKVKTSTGRDVINVQYSKTKAPDNTIINKKGIRMLSEDAWIKDKYSIIAQLQKKKSLTAKESGKLNKALQDVKAFESRELQITPKGLKKFEARLTEFDFFMKTSESSLQAGLRPKAKYKIDPKEIEVFKKDAKPFDVFKDAMIRYNAKLGGSSGRLSAIGKGTRAKTLVSEPSDLDIYVKNLRGMRTFIERGLKAKGYKLIKPEQKITKKNQYKLEKGEDGFEVILKDGKVQVHSEEMLYQNLFSVSSKSPFKPLFEKTPEGIKIPRYELQAKREGFGTFGDSRASKDLPKFITGQKALALEMSTRRKTTAKDYLSQLFGSKKTSGRASKFKRSTSMKPAAEKYGREFERLNLSFLKRSKDTVRMNLLQRKELSKLPEIMKRIKGKPLFIKQKKGKQTEYKYKGLMPPLEPITYAPPQKSSSRTKLKEGYRYFKDSGLYGAGYKKTKSAYPYTKDYKKYTGYSSYDPYKPYKASGYYVGGGGGSGKPYEDYSEYTPYTPYTTYTPYSTYGYDYYKQTPPTTTPAKPPFGFGGFGRQRLMKKPMGYQIKTFGILKLYEEFNKPKIRKTKQDDTFNIL